MSTTVTEVLAPFEGDDLIGLPDLGERLQDLLGVNMDAAARNHAVEKGLICPLDKRGRNGRYMITRQDAVFLVIAAIMAAGAGLAIVTVLRGLRALPADAAAVLAAA